MIRPCLLALVVSTPLAAPAVAQGVFVAPSAPTAMSRSDVTGDRQFLAQELRHLGFADADVGALSNREVVLLLNAVNRPGTANEKTGRVRGILRPGFLQRILNKGLK